MESEEQRQTLRDDIAMAKNFTRNTNLLSYFGEWMPKDNKGGSLAQLEVIAFARFFAHELKVEYSVVSECPR